MIEDPKAGTEEGDTAFAAYAAPGLEERMRAARVEGAGQGSNPWPRDEAGPALAPPPRALPADLAEEMRTASTGDLRSWVEQARVQAERPLELEVAVARTAVDRARSHRDEEALVLQGLQRQLAEAGPWWRPGSWRRRADLKARIAARQQVLTRLSQHLHQTEPQVRPPTKSCPAPVPAMTRRRQRVRPRNGRTPTHSSPPPTRPVSRLTSG